MNVSDSLGINACLSLGRCLEHLIFPYTVSQLRLGFGLTDERDDSSFFNDEPTQLKTGLVKNAILETRLELLTRQTK